MCLTTDPLHDHDDTTKNDVRYICATVPHRSTPYVISRAVEREKSADAKKMAVNRISIICLGHVHHEMTHSTALTVKSTTQTLTSSDGQRAPGISEMITAG